MPCGLQDLSSLTRWSNAGPWQWKCQVQSTVPPGNSFIDFLKTLWGTSKLGISSLRALWQSSLCFSWYLASQLTGLINGKLNYRFEVYRRRPQHPTPVLLPGESHGRRSLVGWSPWGREELDITEWLPFHFHALEKAMATHSSVLAWRIPGMAEPGGLPSMELHRVGHNWSDLAVRKYTMKVYRI